MPLIFFELEQNANDENVVIPLEVADLVQRVVAASFAVSCARRRGGFIQRR